MISYFGYGTNRDHDMMAAMIGREELEGVPAFLPGYELVIQNLKHISDSILPIAPVPRSPREIMASALGNEAKLYIIRPNSHAVTHGTIWQITKEEYEMVRDWELLDFGMQEDIFTQAQTQSGERIQVQTHGSSDPNLPMDHSISGESYENYLIPREMILKTAQRVHQEFLDRKN